MAGPLPSNCAHKFALMGKERRQKRDNGPSPNVCMGLARLPQPWQGLLRTGD